MKLKLSTDLNTGVTSHDSRMSTVASVDAALDSWHGFQAEGEHIVYEKAPSHSTMQKALCRAIWGEF